MSTITFDTHQLVKELQTRGFSTDQAEGINDALKNAMTIAEVATRKDIEEIKRDMKEMELRLTMKIGTLIVAAVGFMVAVQKIL